MNLKDNSGMKGMVRLQVFERGSLNYQRYAGIGRPKYSDYNLGALRQDTGFMENTITNTGKAAIAGLAINSGGITAFGYLALGSDATAASASQTALGTEYSTLGLSRSAATVSRTTVSQTNDTSSLTYTWTATGSTTIQEIGIFNAASVGIMWGRKVTGGVAVINTNSVVATYTVQQL